MPFRQTFLLLFAAFLLMGCGSGKTTIIQPTYRAPKSPSIEISPGDADVPVSITLLDAFENKLDKRLFDKKGFERGRDLTIKYRVTQFDPGGFYGIGGRGSVTFNVNFIDREGRVVSNIEVHSKTGVGSLTGHINHAVWIAARRVANHAEESFQ